jgi:hypothetical protein
VWSQAISQVEIIATPIVAGSQAFLDWIKAETDLK